MKKQFKGKLNLKKTTVADLGTVEMGNLLGGSKPTYEAGCSTGCSMVPPGCVSFPTEEHSVCMCI